MPAEETREFVPAATIEEVIARLDGIIDVARHENSRLGYFAALYSRVTVRVRDGIAAGEFEDGGRMERLDVIFANRYLEALHEFQHETEPSKCWRFAFESTKKWRLLILQHLLLGINAHINLDLGIAAAQTSPGVALPTLKNDFHKINDILASLLDGVQKKINSLSPIFNWIDKIGGRTDEAIMNFSIERARDEAWRFAESLSQLSESEQHHKITEKDTTIEKLGELVSTPGKWISIVLFVIRLFESKDVKKTIDTLF